VSGERGALALVGRGTPLDRAVAVWWAERHGPLALATIDPTSEQEYALASIANEAWAIGRPQVVERIDAAHAASITAFASEVFDRFGTCAVLVVNAGQRSEAPLVELSADEWAAVLRTNLTVPFLALQAFGRLMLREGRGVAAAILPPLDSGDAAMAAARAGLIEVVRRMDEAWGEQGVRVIAVEAADPEALVAVLADALERTAKGS
jgi:NAD(P)-dependent dehydrogenase (short-subunit alcohol dehydrogenase family)